MLIIPAIHLTAGRCIQPKQNPIDPLFSDDPLQMAEHWRNSGAQRLHIVDLEGASAGKPKNAAVIREIIQTAGDDMLVQLGGGIRSLETIEYYLDAGLHYAIIGTAAIKTPGFLHEACDAFPGHVIVSLDAKDGKVATNGWTKMVDHDVVDLAKRFEDYGVEAVIYTDITRDGTLKGINIESTVELAKALHAPVIANGGVAGSEDIDRLCAVEAEGINAVITYSALYAGALDLTSVQPLANTLGQDR